MGAHGSRMHTNSRTLYTLLILLGAATLWGCAPNGSREAAGTVAGSARSAADYAGTEGSPGTGVHPTAAGAAAEKYRYESAGGSYVFPVAAEIDTLEWTEYHWDGSNAVDIFAASGLRADSTGMQAFREAPVLAVADGTARRVDNERGGIAVLLQVDGGRQFYYSHLSDPEFDGEMRVSAGEPIARIGNSGRWSRYIEPHLHFEVIDEWTDGLGWSETVNAARWIRRRFGFRWIDREIDEYPPASPAGPVVDRRADVVRGFDDLRSENADTAGVELVAGDGSEALSSLTGEITVMRATKLGLRVQVTNRHTEQTVVYSGLDRTDLRTGDVVQTGDRIGSVDGVLHVQYFDEGVLRDPRSVMEIP